MKNNELKKKILKSGLGIGATLATILLVNSNVKALEATPDYCFKMDGTKITDYLCYAGNDKGYETITDVVIPDGVTEIGNRAFEGENEDTHLGVPQRKLTSVVISNTVTKIEMFAFYNNLLTNVEIPNSVTTIEARAFENNKLANLSLSNNLTTIGVRAFANNQLINVKIPDNITKIEGELFLNNKLTSVVIPSKVTEIGTGAFSDNLLTNITIPNNVNKIQPRAFANNQLTNVEIPNSVTLLGGFSGNKLTNITIPNSVTTIGTDAFSDNLLTSITIPSKVTEIETGAFSDNKLTNLTIPSNVIIIGTMAFANNNISKVYNYSNISNDELQKNTGKLNNDSNKLIFGRNCSFDYLLGSSCTEEYTLTIINDKNIEDNNSSDDNSTTKPEENNPTMDDNKPSENKPVEDNTPTTKPEEKVETVEKENNGIKLNANANVIDSDITLNVNKLEEHKYKEKVSKISSKAVGYEINLTNINGEKIQPNGNVKISIPIPSNFNKNNLLVYRIEDNGDLTKFNVKVNGEYAEIETDHFSTYILVETIISNPKTLDFNNKNFLILVTICMIVIIILLSKTTKKKKCK